MIRSFKDKDTEALWELKRVPRFQPFLPQARRRLEVLNAAQSLDDLRAIRSNKLHPLHGDRKGQWAIWINTQWRICFKWSDGAVDVEITDYHP